VSDRTKIGSVGNDNVDPSAIPTELFEMDTTSKLLKLKDSWTYEDRFRGNTRIVTTSDILLETDSFILVDSANDVILTLPEGYPVGKRFSVMRTVSSSKYISISVSGTTETIEGTINVFTHPATPSPVLNYQIVSLVKINSNSWIVERQGAIVSGGSGIAPFIAQVGAGIIESGYVSGRGWYIKFGDGTMMQTYWENIQRAFITYTPVSPSGHMCASTGWVWTYPVPFVGNTPRSFICGDVSWGPGLESHLAYPTSTPLTTCNIEVVIGATANASLYVASSYYTIGRWKA
jgi:hypothetical protein